MINRLRAIRLDKGLTLADVAAACDPPTTAQTIGRLETGMRTLSLGWINRIAPALGVEPGVLVRGTDEEPAMVIAALGPRGAEALTEPTEAVLPSLLSPGEARLVMTVETCCGEYRAGDRLWLRRMEPEQAPRLVNRDVLVPRAGGRFAFGRLFDCTLTREGSRMGLLPPASGQRQVVIDNPPWIAVAELLVRSI